MCSVCLEANIGSFRRADSTKRAGAHCSGPRCCSTSPSHTGTCGCVSLTSGSPQTLDRCKPCGRPSRTSGWTESCSCGKSGPVSGQCCCSRAHCSLDFQQPTRSHERRAQTEWTHRAEWLCRTGAVRPTEGTHSGPEETSRLSQSAWSLLRIPQCFSLLTRCYKNLPTLTDEASDTSC